MATTSITRWIVSPGCSVKQLGTFLYYEDPACGIVPWENITPENHSKELCDFKTVLDALGHEWIQCMDGVDYFTSINNELKIDETSGLKSWRMADPFLRFFDQIEIKSKASVDLSSCHPNVWARVQLMTVDTPQTVTMMQCVPPRLKSINMLYAQHIVLPTGQHDGNTFKELEVWHRGEWAKLCMMETDMVSAKPRQTMAIETVHLREETKNCPFWDVGCNIKTVIVHPGTTFSPAKTRSSCIGSIQFPEGTSRAVTFSCSVSINVVYIGRVDNFPLQDITVSDEQVFAVTTIGSLHLQGILRHDAGGMFHVLTIRLLCVSTQSNGYKLNQALEVAKVHDRMDNVDKPF